MCYAGISRHRYTDASDTAGWISGMRTHASFLEELARKGKGVPPLFKYATGLRIHHVMIDVLHIVDQGVTAHVIGTIMLEASAHMEGTTKDQRLHALGQELKEWYSSETGNVYRIKGKINADWLKSGSGFSKFKGKTAETRHLIGFAVMLAKKYYDRSTPALALHSARRLACAEILQRFYVLLAENDMFLSQEAVDEIKPMENNLTI